MDIPAYVLGMCLTHVPGDPLLSVALCRMTYEAQQRVIIPDNPLPEMPGFYKDVAQVCWPKSKC